MEYEYKKEIEISIYDYDNDLIDRIIVDTEREKEEILVKLYHNNEDARFYDLEVIEKHSCSVYKNELLLQFKC
ncbi:hypothetical protein [Bacillus sp. FJAT-22090]|uniref:hypothetical protein n=1 Tax=Bacillus sp. FJAT-22090 TaxID=1581038 RepID=UPI00119CD44E|nr:hypothetical protein [Bacillus sp. FJAT-22090]